MEAKAHLIVVSLESGSYPIKCLVCIDICLNCLQLYMYTQHVFPVLSASSLFAANILQVCTVSESTH